MDEFWHILRLYTLVMVFFARFRANARQKKSRHIFYTHMWDIIRCLKLISWATSVRFHLSHLRLGFEAKKGRIFRKMYSVTIEARAGCPLQNIRNNRAVECAWKWRWCFWQPFPGTHSYEETPLTVIFVCAPRSRTHLWTSHSSLR